jgi:hypothetical protein
MEMIWGTRNWEWIGLWRCGVPWRRSSAPLRNTAKAQKQLLTPLSELIRIVYKKSDSAKRVCICNDITIDSMTLINDLFLFHSMLTFALLNYDAVVVVMCERKNRPPLAVHVYVVVGRAQTPNHSKALETLDYNWMHGWWLEGSTRCVRYVCRTVCF